MGDTDPLYRALNHAQEQFRLVKVSGFHDTLPNCELRVVSLQSDSLDWSALSYRWGDDEATHPISLGGQYFHVRPNLLRFLERMARNNEVDWIFVDAICINQSDYFERAIQVNLMGKIYKRAQQVIVWLPLNVEHEGHRLLQHLQVGDFETYADAARSGSPRCEKRFELLKLGLLACIVDDVFWSRLWIVQEVLLANRLEIWFANCKIDEATLIRDIEARYLASHSLSAQNVMALADTVSVRDHMRLQVAMADCTQTMGPTSTGKVPGVPVAIRMARAAYILTLRAGRGTAIRGGNLLAFHEMVALFNQLHCRLPHDKVFGILGIASTRIIPNYHMPAVDLFINILADSMVSLGFGGLTVCKPGSSLTGDSAERIANIETTVLQAFSVKATHLLIALILQEIYTYFVPVLGDDLRTYSVSRASFWDFHRMSRFRNRAKKKRRWYETRDAAHERHLQSIEGRIADIKHKMNEARSKNEALVAPWRTNDDKEDIRRYEVWVQMVHDRCESILQRSVRAAEM